MKKLLLWIASFLLFLALLAAVLPFLIPAEQFKQPLLALLERETGRKVRIDGPISLHLFPDISLNAEQASLSNPSWAGGEMFTAKKLSLGVKLMPLFHKRIELTGIELDSPTIRLIRKGDRANWQFSPAKSAPAASAATAEKTESSAPASVQLSTVEISNGVLTFEDLAAKTSYRATGVSLELNAKSLSDDAGLKGAFTYNGHDFKIETRVSSIVDAMTSEGAKFSLVFNTDGMGITWNGTLSDSDQLRISGPFTLDTDHFKALAPLDKSVPPEFQDINVNGSLVVTQPQGVTSLALSDAAFVVNNKQAQGNITVRLAQKPDITGAIRMDALDVTPYLDSSSEPTAATEENPSPVAAKRSDFSALRNFNAALDLAIGELTAKKVKLNPVNVKLNVRDGALQAKLAPASIYGGTINGAMTLHSDASLSTNGELAQVNAEPMLTELADFKRLSGTLASRWSLHTTLGSGNMTMSQLGGSGLVTFTDGAIKGINLAAMVRNVTSAFTETDTQSQQTDFSELSGSYTIQSGVLHNEDLILKSPLLRVRGAGDVNLPQQRVQYRLVPELVASLEGQGGADVGGIKVPVMVEGTFDKLRFRPDLKGVVEEGLRNPEQIENTVKSVKDGFKDIKKGGFNADALKGLFQKKPEGN